MNEPRIGDEWTATERPSGAEGGGVMSRAEQIEAAARDVVMASWQAREDNLDRGGQVVDRAAFDALDAALALSDLATLAELLSEAEAQLPTLLDRIEVAEAKLAQATLELDALWDVVRGYVAAPTDEERRLTFSRLLAYVIQEGWKR